MRRIIQSIAASLYNQIPLTKTIKTLKNYNDNRSGNDNIDNKKVPHKPHIPVISFQGYKHNPPSN